LKRVLLTYFFGRSAVPIACLLLGGCAAVPVNEGVPGAAADPVERASAPSLLAPPTMQARARHLLVTPAQPPFWEALTLPGKPMARFEPDTKAGRLALRVSAHRSVSILRQHFPAGLDASATTLSFSWMVDALPMGADLRDARREDAPVRILLAFDGDRARWPASAHRLSEWSRLLTGEELPYATLSYVWSPTDAPGTVVVNPRTDRLRKLVVDGGATHLGQWREHHRHVRDDFVQAFGEEPGRLRAIALMTDTDNTQSSLEAWYGALRLQERLPGDTP
jgi:hypothetical protein